MLVVVHAVVHLSSPRTGIPATLTASAECLSILYKESASNGGICKEGNVEFSKKWEQSRVIVASDWVVIPLEDRRQNVSFRLGIVIYPPYILGLEIRETELWNTLASEPDALLHYTRQL